MNSAAQTPPGREREVFPSPDRGTRQTQRDEAAGTEWPSPSLSRRGQTEELHLYLPAPQEPVFPFPPPQNRVPKTRCGCNNVEFPQPRDPQSPPSSPCPTPRQRGGRTRAQPLCSGTPLLPANPATAAMNPAPEGEGLRRGRAAHGP